MFSFCGAQQLQLDARHVQRWLSEHVSEQQVRQTLLALPAFGALNKATELLLQQPHSGQALSGTKQNSVSHCDLTGKHTAAPSKTPCYTATSHVKAWRLSWLFR